LIDAFLSNIYLPETFGQLSHVSVAAKGVIRVISVEAASPLALGWRQS
jgi:3-dehydroquinate dehydratase